MDNLHYLFHKNDSNSVVLMNGMDHNNDNNRSTQHYQRCAKGIYKIIVRAFLHFTLLLLFLS